MLDDLARIKSIDREGMIGNIMKISSLIESGYRLATDLDISFDKSLNGIHLLGLGGSAIGGDFTRDWLGKHIPGGVVVERGYHLTKPIEHDSLIICCSYSGNTLETRSMLEEVLRSRSEGVILVSSDGALTEIAREKSLPIIPLEKGLPPRASLPSVVAAIAALSDRIGWTRDASSEILTASEACTQFMRSQLAPEISTEDNVAKQLAHKIHGFIPVAISPYTMESIARRWKTQMNENAKQHCFFGSFPEISHNELVPWLRDSRSDMLVFLLLRDVDEAPQLKEDIDRLREYLTKSARLIDIQSMGKSRIEFLMNHVLIADLTSVYAAILSEIDPSPVNEIARFKSRSQ